MKLSITHKPGMFMMLLLVSIVASSCASSSETEHKSLLNYFNGEHYKMAGNDSIILGGPTIPVETKNVDTSISGTIFLNEFTPLKFKKIFLTKNDQVILETTTNQVGSFKFSGYLPNGKYTLKNDSKESRLAEEIIVDKYEIGGLSFSINKNK